MNWHEVWVWLWYMLGMASYWLKRAYFGIQPPSPVATGYVNYIQRAWAPLLVRAILESGLFWILFTPGVTDKALAYFGWTSYGWAIQVITSVAPAALFFGHAADSIADFAVSKIPGVRDALPQMPGPLPQKAVVEAQIVQQTVTQLQSTTTVIPEAKP